MKHCLAEPGGRNSGAAQHRVHQQEDQVQDQCGAAEGTAARDGTDALSSGGRPQAVSAGSHSEDNEGSQAAEAHHADT